MRACVRVVLGNNPLILNLSREGLVNLDAEHFNQSGECGGGLYIRSGSQFETEIICQTLPQHKRHRF